MNIYKMKAIKHSLIGINIIAKSEDEAIDIMDKLIDEFDMFDKVEDYEITFEAKKTGDIYDIVNDYNNSICLSCGESI